MFKGKSSGNIRVKLHPCLPDDSFKMSRLFPTKSNIRKQWYSGDEDTEGEAGGKKCVNNSIQGLAQWEYLNTLGNCHLVYLNTFINNKPGKVWTQLVVEGPREQWKKKRLLSHKSCAFKCLKFETSLRKNYFFLKDYVTSEGAVTHLVLYH